MSPDAPLRGQVCFVDLPEAGRKPVLIVSNNRRNRNLRDVVVVRITSAPKPDIPSIVPLPDSEPVSGRVLCDDLATVSKASLDRPVGGLSRATMELVDAGLKVALGLRGR